jgi:hypothetical protein
MGPQNFIMLTLWCRVFSFDWYRMTPMTHLLSSLHLGTAARVKQKALVAGLVAALLVAFVVAFFSFNYTCYAAPGGARQFGAAFDIWPDFFYRDYARQVAKIKSFEQKRAEYAEEGKAIPTPEVRTRSAT